MQPAAINNKLRRLYGLEKETGQPKYRVIRSELQFEDRAGDYNVFTEGGIFLRREKGIRRVKKYHYLKNCWLLERVEPNKFRDEYITAKFTYEPLFPFLDAKDKPLPLEWKPIEFLLGTLEKAEKHFLTEGDHFEMEMAMQKRKEEKMMNELDRIMSGKQLPTFNTSTLIPKTPSKAAIDRQVSKQSMLSQIGV